MGELGKLLYPREVQILPCMDEDDELEPCVVVWTFSTQGYMDQSVLEV